MGFAFAFVAVLGYYMLRTPEQVLDTGTAACPYKMEPATVEPPYLYLFNRLHTELAYDPNDSRFKLNG